MGEAIGVVAHAPTGGIARQNTVDGEAAAAGELFVKGVVANGVGVTEDREQRAGRRATAKEQPNWKRKLFSREQATGRLPKVGWIARIETAGFFDAHAH